MRLDQRHPALSTPDTTNDSEPQFPGFPNTGAQPSDRYTAQANLRSTLTANLVNEFKIGGSGGATMFSPEIGTDQFKAPVANRNGFLLDINDDGDQLSDIHRSDLPARVRPRPGSSRTR